MAVSFIEGNEAIARAAIHSGCTFFAGYPITPATTIFNHMLRLMPGKKSICLQGEDEIASMGYCIGASMAGRKVMTATSGPGISLYSEQISFAIASEIPMVIVDVQRLGPSTGSATRGADSDIQFLRWGNTGGIPVIVLAPSDVQECYTLTLHAFNFAEQFRCPVFIASNKEIALTKESVDLTAVKTPEIINRSYYSGNTFQPYQADENNVPAFLPIGGKTIVRQTSSTHGPDGFITIDPSKIQALEKRLTQKIETARDTLNLWEQTIHDQADTLIISYGITSRAAQDATEQLVQKKCPVSHLSLKTLWPVPEKVIQKAADAHVSILVVEMNMGQYVREIQRILPDKSVQFFGQMDSTLITPSTIMEAVKHV